VTPEEFVSGFVAQLRGKAADLRSFGASDSAQTCERNAQDLEDACRAWWLAELTVADAAKESGYSEERLRQMARDGELPHKKGDGSKGHLRIARRDLPHRPKAVEAPVSDIGERLLRKREKGILRPAS
jgi:helix-turn-helix protein